MKMRELGRRIPSGRLCSIAATRSLSHSAQIQNVTKHIKFFQSNASNPSLAGTGGRPPVVVLLPWLKASDRAVEKVVDYHTSKGRDVVTCRTEVNEFLQYSKTQQNVDDLLQFSTEEQMSKRWWGRERESAFSRVLRGSIHKPLGRSVGSSSVNFSLVFNRLEADDFLDSEIE